VTFRLAVSAEMVFLDLPFEERVRRISAAGFEVEIWDWTKKDVDALVRTGATFSSMTGYITGALADPDGADELVRTAEESLKVAEQLDCPRLNLHGTGLDGQGLPVVKADVVTLKEKSREMVVVQWNTDVLDRTPPPWLEKGDGGFTVTVRELPLREHIDVPVREQLIVELYSK